MKLIENLNIKRRLIMILSIWIIIFVSFGIFALIQMRNLGNVTKSVYEHPLKVTISAKEAYLNILKIQSRFDDIQALENEADVENEIEKIKAIEERVYDSFDEIRRSTTIDESKELEMQAREIFTQWYDEKKVAVKGMLRGELQQDTGLSKVQDKLFLDKIEEMLDKVVANSLKNSDELINETIRIEYSQRNVLISILALVSGISFALFTILINSIIKPITVLKTTMKTSTDTGNLALVHLTGKNEIVEMATFYNTLVNKLSYMFWTKDTQNRLSQELSVCISTEELARKAINFLAEVVNAGKGVLYIYDNESNKLHMEASFAFTKDDRIYEELSVGEGIIGQVALQRKPILQEGIKDATNSILTGIIEEAPLNIYTFPLVYEKELYGVVSLASFKQFNKAELEFLGESSKIIATNLYSAIQNQKIKYLLQVSEEAREEVRKSAEGLENANTILKEKQEILQRQSEELQKTNLELEEQQKILQQQSKELRQTNIQLEEQQRQLEEQARTLNLQNKQLEENSKELSRRSQELEKINNYKSEFLATMSHELRTPLNSIILLSRLLLDKDRGLMEESVKEKISVINKSGQELLRLINDILDISKIEAGRMSVDAQEFKSDMVIQHMRQMFEGPAKEKNLEFILEDSVQDFLYGDMHKIFQILRNFISNAIKFTEQGSVTLKIMRDKMRENGIIFLVKDTGIGIAEQQQSIIFENFQQGDGSISRKYGGTGLGLSISKKLSDLIGAKIEVNSKIGVGSEFYLYVPNLIFSNEVSHVMGQAAAADENGIIHGVSGLSPSMNTKKEESEFNFDGKTILIVDDDPRNIFVVAAALEDCGAEVVEASSGSAALQKLRRQKVDLILMDIMMPETDGFQTIRAIRDMTEFADIPIIAVTAKALKEDKLKCIEAGADDYISKPIDYNTLMHMIKVWIR